MGSIDGDKLRTFEEEVELLLDIKYGDKTDITEEEVEGVREMVRERMAKEEKMNNTMLGGRIKPKNTAEFIEMVYSDTPVTPLEEEAIDDLIKKEGVDGVVKSLEMIGPEAIIASTRGGIFARLTGFHGDYYNSPVVLSILIKNYEGAIRDGNNERADELKKEILDTGLRTYEEHMARNFPKGVDERGKKMEIIDQSAIDKLNSIVMEYRRRPESERLKSSVILDVISDMETMPWNHILETQSSE